MKFWYEYFKQYKKGVLFFVLSCVVFLCVFFLYHLPVGAVLYPALICSLLGVLFLFFDIRQKYRKHRRLAELMKLPAELLEQFPEGDTMEARDYQELIRLLQEEQRQLLTRMDVRYQDMLDYYTVWVHQIKTPIASMRLHLQNEDSDFSRTIADDLLRIEQYVEMVLCYLRLDSDTTDYVIRECDLDAIVRAAVKKFAGQFIRRRIRLDYKPLQGTVLTDEKWLSFVIEQVLSNALKYTEQGSVAIGLEEPKTLYIRDTGIGIAPEDLPRVFDRGYTGYNGRSDKKATGIGLYISQRICRNLGHSITIDSDLDRGTIVRIGLFRDQLEVE